MRFLTTDFSDPYQAAMPFRDEHNGLVGRIFGRDLTSGMELRLTKLSAFGISNRAGGMKICYLFCKD
jgi:hypothetical protein